MTSRPKIDQNPTSFRRHVFTGLIWPTRLVEFDIQFSKQFNLKVKLFAWSLLFKVIWYFKHEKVKSNFRVGLSSFKLLSWLECIQQYLMELFCFNWVFQYNYLFDYLFIINHIIQCLYPYNYAHNIFIWSYSYNCTELTHIFGIQTCHVYIYMYQCINTWWSYSINT